MHAKQYNEAKWISPSSLTVKTENGTIEAIERAGGATLAANLEFVFSATSPLNSTALKGANEALAAIEGNGKPSDLFTLSWPVLNLEASEKAGNAVYTAGKHIAYYRATREVLIEACKAIQASNAMTSKTATGGVVKMTAYFFKPLADKPAYDIGNNAATGKRGKTSGKGFKI